MLSTPTAPLGPGDDLDKLQAIFGGELEVALVVGGHGHHRAGAVLHEHEVGHVHRDAPAGEGMGAPGLR